VTGGRAALAGVYEYPDRVAPGVSALQIKAGCAIRALAASGLSLADVDALYDAGEAITGPGLAMPEYLGIRPMLVDSTAVGGSSFEYHVAHAVDAIEAGRIRVALLTYGSTARSSKRSIGTEARPASIPDPLRNMEDSYGLTTIGSYAMVAKRHMSEFGTTAEELAEIAVVTRYHALRNPAAVAGLTAIGMDPVPLTASDVVASRLISSPIHRLECCLITDGGGAVVIVAPKLADDLDVRPVWVLGSATSVEYNDFGRSVLVTSAARCGPAAFGQAGVRPDEIDIAMIYDSFTITVLTILEDLGFCAKGEGGAYVRDGRLRFDQPGGPALNTDGGGLSSTHPGMRGIFLLIEAARQLRGESTAQVPSARLAVAHGNGGRLGSRSAGGTVILGVN
jgi:acetyl-CoA C-acetyltransferase